MTKCGQRMCRYIDILPSFAPWPWLIIAGTAHSHTPLFEGPLLMSSIITWDAIKQLLLLLLLLLLLDLPKLIIPHP
jgi:hypothetical protein